jgi:hypothetical protein
MFLLCLLYTVLITGLISFLIQLYFQIKSIFTKENNVKIILNVNNLNTDNEKDMDRIFKELAASLKKLGTR